MPPKGGSQTHNDHFPSKIAILLEKVCYKVSLCETVSDKVVRHSLTYLSVQKWFVGDVVVCAKICPKMTHPLQQRRFPINIRP